MFLDAVSRFARPGSAVDLGCGDGTETQVLLERGWTVTALDAEPDAIRRVLERTEPEQHSRLETQVVSFEAMELPEVDLVYAGLSLPFCAPEHFAAVWHKVVRAVRPGGRFAGQLFGERDSWTRNPGMTFQRADEARGLLTGFDLERFDELERDTPTAFEANKHLHAFEIIARKIG